MLIKILVKTKFCIQQQQLLSLFGKHKNDEVPCLPVQVNQVHHHFYWAMENSFTSYFVIYKTIFTYIYNAVTVYFASRVSAVRSLRLLSKLKMNFSYHNLSLNHKTHNYVIWKKCWWSIYIMVPFCYILSSECGYTSIKHVTKIFPGTCLKTCS